MHELFQQLSEIETVSAYATVIGAILLVILPLTVTYCYKRMVLRVLWGLLAVAVIVFLIFKPLVFDGIIENEQVNSLKKAVTYDTLASVESEEGILLVQDQGDHKDLIFELSAEKEPICTQIVWGAVSILPPHGPYGRYYYHVTKDASGTHFESYRPIRKEQSE